MRHNIVIIAFCLFELAQKRAAFRAVARLRAQNRGERSISVVGFYFFVQITIVFGAFGNIAEYEVRVRAYAEPVFVIRSELFVFFGIDRDRPVLVKQRMYIYKKIARGIFPQARAPSGICVVCSRYTLYNKNTVRKILLQGDFPARCPLFRTRPIR